MKRITCITLVLVLIATIGYATKAVGQSDRKCVDLWKDCYSGECDSLRLFQQNGRCIDPAGDYFIRADEDGLFIYTEQHGSYDISSLEIAASVKPGMQGIYTIKKNKNDTLISTDKLGDFRIEPERISEEEARVRAQQDAEWEEMERETARRDVEDTKARVIEEEERGAEKALQEAEEEARKESERRMEAEQREIERKLGEKGTVTVDPYLRAPVIKGRSE